MDSNFSRAGSELYHKLNKRLKDLRARVASEEEIAAANPHFELKRARSSVKYHAKLLQEHDDELEERIRKAVERIKEEAATKRAEKEKNLAEAKVKLEEEEKKTPRSVFKARQELLNHIKHFQESLAMPKGFFPELNEVSFTPAKPAPAATPAIRIKTSFELEEEELARTRRLAQEDLAMKKREEAEKEQEKREKALEALRRERAIQEEQDRRRQDEIRRKELESRVPEKKMPQIKEEEEEEEEMDIWDLDGMTEHAKEQLVRSRARCGMSIPEAFQKYVHQLPPSAPPAQPKKPIKRTVAQLSTIAGLAVQKYAAPSDE